MAGGKHHTGIVQLYAHLVALARHQRRRRFVAVAMREVQDAKAHAQRFARWMNVAQPDREVGDRLVGRDVEREDRRAETLDRTVEDGGFKN